MSPELIKAIKERIAAGQAKENIKADVLATGYTEEVFESAYTLAQSDLENVLTSLPAVPAAALPTAYELLSGALAFIVRRFDTVLIVLVPGLLLFGFTYAGERISEPLALSVAVDALAVIAFLIYVAAIFSVMYIVVNEEGVPTYVEGMRWARQNILPLFLVSILMFLVIIGGFVLFIIPGLILSFTLGFSQYALILEQQKGMNALARSRELLRGRVWAVGLKLLAFYLYIFAPLFLFLIGGFITVTAVPALIKFSLVGEIALELVSATLTIVGVYAMARLYRSLQIGRPLTESASRRRGGYWFLAFLGVATIISIAAVVIYFEPNLDERIIVDSTTLQSEVQSMKVAAISYATEHEGSFVGVCDTLRPRLLSADVVECNDTETQWAILGMVGDERFCADTTTTGKQVKSALGERLTCLSLPEKQPIESPAGAASTTDAATDTPNDSESNIE